MSLLRWHAFGFALASFALISGSAPSWLLWSMCGWSLALLAHWLYVKSISVDEAWAERRALEVQYKSYDFGHIQQIKASYEADTQSDRSLNST